MTELLLVVALIGVIAAAASPSIMKAMQDGRVQKAAFRVAELVRFAKSRAVGRGAAVAVRWDVGHAFPTTVNPNGRLSVREAIEPVTELPSASCVNTNWNDNSANSRHVATFDDRSSIYDAPVSVTLIDLADNVAAAGTICFSPRGRAFVRFTANGAFSPLAGVPRFGVLNTESSFQRMVIIPPNGVAHVVGRID
jgi:type IV fimbrial biogenesis protein FimT